MGGGDSGGLWHRAKSSSRARARAQQSESQTPLESHKALTRVRKSSIKGDSETPTSPERARHRSTWHCYSPVSAVESPTRAARSTIDASRPQAKHKLKDGKAHNDRDQTQARARRARSQDARRRHTSRRILLGVREGRRERDARRDPPPRRAPRRCRPRSSHFSAMTRPTWLGRATIASGGTY